jgi:Rrf2 family iron-sulfur cluster assembly transcriptional regulator
MHKEPVMRLSTKSRFAVTAMVDLALRDKLGPVSLASISARHGMSTSYLEQLFSRLRQQGLVASTRGPGGGYTLGRALTAISVADIISAIESTPADHTDEVSSTLTQELWSDLNTKMMAHLQTVTLGSLVTQQLAKGVQVEQRPASRRGIFAQRREEPATSTIPNSVFALAGKL